MHVRFNQSASTAPDRAPDLLLFGDPHGDFLPVVSAVRRLQPKAIILLGDLTPTRPLHIELASILDETEIWFIHGNHDTDREDSWLNISTRLAGTALEGRNLHGRAAVLGDKRVAGLGGVFRGSVWMPTPESRLDQRQQVVWHSQDELRRHHKPAERWRDGVSLRHRSTIFPAEVDALAAYRVDILVTHESPSLERTGLDSRWHHGFRVVSDLADRLGVNLVVHGHHHEDIDYQQQCTHSTARRWQAFGVNQGSCLVVHF